MDVIVATLVLVAGVVMFGIGMYARVRNVALGGVANILAASSLFPHGGFGLRHWMSLLVLAVLLFVVFRLFNREIWRSIRVEVVFGLAIITNVWASELLGTRGPRELRLGLLGLLGFLTATWMGLILVRVTREHFERFLKR